MLLTNVAFRTWKLYLHEEQIFKIKNKNIKMDVPRFTSRTLCEWVLYRYIANWNMALRVLQKRHMTEREKWWMVGTKQTRPLHQTANSEVVCSHWTLCATREKKDRDARTSGGEKRQKKKKGDQRKRLATGRHVMSFPASSCILFFLPSLIPPRVSAIYSSYFITRPRNRNTLQTSVRLSSWVFDLVLGFDKT